MNEKPALCKGCPWEGWSHGYVPPFGTCSNKILLVSDYPEFMDLDANRPFSGGREGDMLNRTLRRLHEKRENYGISYITHCRPNQFAKDGRLSLEDCKGWEQAARCCHDRHEQWLHSINCSVAVALGTTALSQLTGLPATDRTRGYVWRMPDSIPIVGTYHPYTVGAGNTGLLFTLRYDLANALRKASPDFGSNPKNFIIDPTPSQFLSLISDICSKSRWCVVDIETPQAGEDESEYSEKPLSFTINRVSICAEHDIDTSITFPWLPPYFDGFRKLIESGLDIVYWNGEYDDPRLAYNGFNRAGRFVDAMWLWNFLQPDLPKALAHVATYYTDLPEWKSKSQEDPAYYSCCDGYSEAHCYSQILKDLEKKGMLDIADRHVTQILGILRKIRSRGIQVDSKVLDQIKKDAKERLDVWDQRIKELCPVDARGVKWYKKPPPGYKSGKVYEGLQKTIGGKPGIYIRSGEIWGFRFDFNPNSPDQLKNYLRFKGIKVPKLHKTRRETTDNKSLRDIYAKTKDPLIKEIVDRAKTAKIYSTYTNWPMDESGRVHPSLGLDPATGRFSCRRPNFQNIPKEGEWAQLLRRAIVPSPGCVLISADYVGMESFLTGYFANDPVYMKLSTMNIYAYVAAKRLGWPLDEENDDAFGKQLSDYKKRSKKIIEHGDTKSLYDKFKAIVLGIGYGEGRNTLFYGNPGLFRDLGEAGQLRKFVLDTFPRVRAWQEQVVNQAASGFLFNPWHYIRYFLDCPGSDSSKAMAQLPQSSGAAMIKDVILLLNDTWLGRHLILQIHDELVWDCPEGRQDEAVELIRSVMTRKWPELGGNSIQVSIKCGMNLADMKDC